MAPGQQFRGILLGIGLAGLAGCASMADSMSGASAERDTGEEMELPAYDGPKAKVAVSKFEWKADSGGKSVRISGLPTGDVSISEKKGGVMDGMRDMLTTAMLQSDRFRVLERQELEAIRDEQGLAGSDRAASEGQGVESGQVQTADLLVVAAITGWEDNTKGSSADAGGGGLLGTAGAAVGAVTGAMDESKVAMDIRIIDTNTSEVLEATRVEGTATDADLGGALGGFGGGIGAVGGMSGYSHTPMEKAIRTTIYKAVKFLAEETPRRYFKES